MESLTYHETDGGRAQHGYRGENNDCVVKSIAIATGIPYPEVHAALKARGRVNGRGTKGYTFMPFLNSPPYVKPIVITPETCRVFSFFQANPKGTFLVIVPKHMTVIKAGVCLDEFPPKPKQRVQYAYQVMDAEDYEI